MLLLYPLPPPPATNLTADNFASFFTEKVAAIGKQFDQLSPPLRAQPSMAHRFLLSFLSKILTGSRPTTVISGLLSAPEYKPHPLNF